MVLTRDNQFLITGSVDKTVRIFSVGKNKVIKLFGRAPNSIKIQQMFSGQKRIKLDIHHVKKIYLRPGDDSLLVWSTDLGSPTSRLMLVDFMNEKSIFDVGIH